MDDALHPAAYEKLAAQEAEFWGSVRPRDDNPRLWDDPFLFDLFLKPHWVALIETVVSLGKDALEVGCGEGNLAIELARRGLRVDAVDLSGERIREAQEKAGRLHPANPPSFRVADLNVAALPRERYDVVVAHDALHHILNLDRLLDEISSSLRPGGTLVVYDYVGMGKVRRALAAFLYAVLPTYQPYGMKLRLASRLPRFFQSEEGKRKSLGTRPADNESPFEEISQGSIVRLIRQKFDLRTERSMHPFLFYLAPKVRLPRFARERILTWMARMDEWIASSFRGSGAYVYLVAGRKA